MEGDPFHTFNHESNRRQFVASALSAIGMITLSGFRNVIEGNNPSTTMPVLFVGHGNPMNALEDNAYSRTWQNIAVNLPRPQAILCISAHWQTRGTWVTAMKNPETIHDFGGFPQALFDKQYPAPGAPAFAEQTKSMVIKTDIQLDHEWGLDHGTWSVLSRMYPKADIPVYQLSLDYTQSPEWHYRLAQELMPLRRKGVLIIGSGNIVHNLGLVDWNGKAYDWAIEFDQYVKTRIDAQDHEALIRYDRMGGASSLAIPTNEHYLPLLYTLALQDSKEPHAYFAEDIIMGSVSMRSVKFGY